MKNSEEIESILIEAEQRDDLVNVVVLAMKETQCGMLGDVLCKLHNTDRINLTSNQNLLSIHTLEHNEFWRIFTLLCDVIPELNCSHREILKLVHMLVEKAGADFSAGKPNQSLIIWSQRNTVKAQEIIDGIKKQNEHCLAHGVFAVLGLGDETLTFELVRHPKEEVVRIGLRALGLMESLSMKMIKKGVDDTFSIIKRETDSDVRFSAIDAAFRLWKKLGQSEPYRQQEFIEAIGQRGDADEMSYLSMMLFLHHEGLPKESIDLVLDLLAKVPSNSAVTLQQLDNAINMADDRWEFRNVVSVFTNCIPSLNGKYDQLDFHNFTNWVWNNSENASYLFAKWLKGGDYELCTFLLKLFRGSSNQISVWIHKEHLPPNAIDQICMARRSIGFLCSQQIAVASILLSIIKNGKKGAAKVAEDLVFDPLLLSYLGDLRDFIHSQHTNRSRHISLCVERLLKKHDEYIAGIEMSKDLVELLPSIEQQRAVARKDRDFAINIQKRAYEQSEFIDAMTTQTLLYGRKNFTVTRGIDGTKQPSVFGLSEFSQSIELPRLMSIDPVGFCLTLTIFRRLECEPK